MRNVIAKLRAWWARWSWPTTASLSVVVWCLLLATGVVVVRLLWRVLFGHDVVEEPGRLLLAMWLGFLLALVLLERLGFYWKRKTYVPAPISAELPAINPGPVSESPAEPDLLDLEDAPEPHPLASGYAVANRQRVARRSASPAAPVDESTLTAPEPTPVSAAPARLPSQRRAR